MGSYFFKNKMGWIVTLSVLYFLLVSIYQIKWKPCCDVYGYQNIAKHYSDGGWLQSFPGMDRRTYVYPALLSFFVPLSVYTSISLSFFAGLLNLALFVGLIWLLGRKLKCHSFVTNRIIFFATLFNFFIYPFVALALTEAVVATTTSLLLVISIIFLETGAKKWAYLAFIFVLSALLMMMRPANVFLIFLMGYLLFCYYQSRKVSDSKIKLVFDFVGLSALAMIPFAPQVGQNLIVFDKFAIFSAFDLGGAQIEWGQGFLKYATLMKDGSGLAMPFFNPFFPSGDHGVGLHWYFKNVVAGSLTILGHIFAALDVETPFTYIYNPTPFYRWPLAILGHVYILSIFFGAVMILRGDVKFLANNASKKFVFLSLFYCIGWAGTIAFTAAETRFGLPVFVLASLYFWICVLHFKKLRQLPFFVFATAMGYGIMAVSYGVLFDLIKAHFLERLGF